jgi:DNA-binding MarR family transcriptional regulator
MLQSQKGTILAYLTRVPDATAAELAEALDLSLPAAGMALLRLTRSGLVSRVFDRRHGCHCYAVTPKGRARLEFLREGNR